MSKPQVEVLSPKTSVGKSPHWDEATQSLYYVDMFEGTVHNYRPDCDKVHSATIGSGTDKPLAIIVPVEGQKDNFIVSIKNDLSLIKWDGVACKTSEPRVIQNLEPNDNTNRINNGKVDPKGRLWAGTTGRALPSSCPNEELKFEEGVASLYMLNDCNKFTKLTGNVSVANGTEWSGDNKKFYFTDSAKKVLDVYDYCHDEGKISNPKPIFDLKENKLNGLLDGMVISKSGKLYIANYLGYAVLVVDTNTCKLINKIEIPSKQVTSCCWGGPQNDILFVTTGYSEPDPNCQNSGHIFKVTNLCDKGVASRSAVL